MRKKKAKSKSPLYGRSKKQVHKPSFNDSQPFQLYGKLDEPRVCTGKDCKVKLSIRNKFDLCNVCREKEIAKLMTVHGSVDAIIKFDKEHRAKPIKRFIIDPYMIEEYGLGTPDRG